MGNPAGIDKVQPDFWLDFAGKWDIISRVKVKVEATAANRGAGTRCRVRRRWVPSYIYILFQIRVSPTRQTQENKVSAAALCLRNLQDFTGDGCSSSKPLSPDLQRIASMQPHPLARRKGHCHFLFSSAGHQDVLRETDLTGLGSSRLCVLAGATAPAPPRPHPIWFSKFNHMSVQCLDWGKHGL